MLSYVPDPRVRVSVLSVVDDRRGVDFDLQAEAFGEVKHPLRDVELVGEQVVGDVEESKGDVFMGRSSRTGLAFRAM